ncbi:molecular chaperone [Luteimonas marina]|uniref:Molecular chaperone n=1 Tax=Luteimonas marina TaxID=488485 RepID=A0A5C5U2N4_9GAMM|nr:fimbria/pilus periplasmic chaperone [Luteimonas marina]TWT20204.1 molecular chaperone [Luteimonas marina]
MRAFPAPLRRSPRLQAWLLGACLLLAGSAVQAASLQVAPILVEFQPDQQAQALWLTNTGDAPLHAQVRVQQWTQADGAEQLAPTRDLVASPAIVEIAPGQKQLVRLLRLLRLQPAATGREQAYRVLVDELPRTDGPAGSGLTLLLRYSIPAFVLKAGATPVIERAGPAPLADLSQVSATLGDGDGTLSVANGGDQRLRIMQLAYVNPDGSRIVLNDGLVGYVLAGQRMQWPLVLPSAARPGGSLRAVFNHDGQEQALPPAPSDR